MKTIILSVLFTLISLPLFQQKDSTIRFSNISIDTLGDLKWTTSYIFDIRGGSLNVECLKGDKWIVIDGSGWSVALIEGSEIPKTAIRESKRDSIRVKFHQGLNKYRITADISGKKAVSQEIQLVSKVSNDDGSIWISGSNIIMDKKEYYEIINQSGSTIQKGEAKIISIASLDKGSYFLYTKTATKPFTK
jgi:hypothetical protein